MLTNSTARAYRLFGPASVALQLEPQRPLALTYPDWPTAVPGVRISPVASVGRCQRDIAFKQGIAPDPLVTYTVQWGEINNLVGSENPVGRMDQSKMKLDVGQIGTHFSVVRRRRSLVLLRSGRCEVGLIVCRGQIVECLLAISAEGGAVHESQCRWCQITQSAHHR